MDVYSSSGEERKWSELGCGLLNDLIIELLNCSGNYLVVSLLNCLMVKNVVVNKEIITFFISHFVSQPEGEF
jgi:hypothetical protein